jgi:radical SAM superfamily enzyme YgiQ (UPF0313 family)
MAEDMVRVRPPSEANSFLLPVTLGCSNNTCTFCGTYSDVRFRIRDIADIKKDIDRVPRCTAGASAAFFSRTGTPW